MVRENKDRKISLVVTVMNEKPNVGPLINAVKEALQDINYELIFVDDGSTDGTGREINKFANEQIVLVQLSRNYGQSIAMAAGIDQATGKYIVTMDGDLQNDPADIPVMLKMMENEEWDLIAGRRKNRKDNLLKKIPSRIANKLIRSLTKVNIHDYGCTLKIFRSDLAKDLGLYGELHRFIPALAFFQGARICEVDVTHHHRQHGQSKYGIGRTFKVMSDLLLILFYQRYLSRPMHLFGAAGILVFIVGVLLNLYLLGLKIAGQDIWGKPLLILALLFTLGGIQLITIGILAELLMRIYYESQAKKPYKIRHIYAGGKEEQVEEHNKVLP